MEPTNNPYQYTRAEAVKISKDALKQVFKIGTSNAKRWQFIRLYLFAFKYRIKLDKYLASAARQDKMKADVAGFRFDVDAEIVNEPERKQLSQ